MGVRVHEVTLHTCVRLHRMQELAPTAMTTKRIAFWRSRFAALYLRMPATTMRGRVSLCEKGVPPQPTSVERILAFADKPKTFDFGGRGEKREDMIFTVHGQVLRK